MPRRSRTRSAGTRKGASDEVINSSNSSSNTLMVVIGVIVVIIIVVIVVVDRADRDQNEASSEACLTQVARITGLLCLFVCVLCL